MKRKAVYPGSFDPVTNGHVDVITRALKIFDTVYIAIARNTSKDALFAPEERARHLRHVTKDLPGVTVEIFEGLVVDYAREKGVPTLIRGIRAISDFDYEFQMALANRKLKPEVETIFLMPSEDNFYISSRIIKEIAILEGEVGQFVSPFVAQEVRKKLQEKHII